MDKHSPRHSPVKQPQKLEKHDSLSSLRSLNSYLSGCDGMDANYLLEDESVYEEDEKKFLHVKPDLRQRQSMISGGSLNSFLSLVEDDHVRHTSASVDYPTIRISTPEDDKKENKTVTEKEEFQNGELTTEKRKERSRKGRTTSDERSQTGSVSN